jgi:hypothetical protein
MLSYADYLIVISLPDDVKNQIGRYKRASVNLIGEFEGIQRTPYLIITHQVRCKPFLVQPAIDLMAKRISTMPPIELQINGFGNCSKGYNAKSIYAQIAVNEKVNNWFKLLNKQIGLKTTNAVPHIPLVPNIPLTAFNKLWPNLVNKPLITPFTVNSLTILHRDTFADYCEWALYKELTFGNRLLAF